MNDRTYITIYHTNTEGKTTPINISFDTIDKVSIDMNLSVCTSDCIRGKNKTDHAYIEPKSIKISGTFGERGFDNNFFKFGDNKLQNIQKLFESFIQDVRVFDIHTRFREYKNYVLTKCSFSTGNYINSMTFSFNFDEILFRNNEALQGDGIIQYSPPLESFDIELEENPIRIQVSEQIVDIYNSIVSSFLSIINEVFK